jgi:tRNA G10  N-methylase Trm11
MVSYLLDTCFIFHILEEEKEKQLIHFCENQKVGITSFNLEEINHNLHKMNHQVKLTWKNFLSKNLFEEIKIDVFPGEREKERDYVKTFDEKLLQIIPDASDAVLLVAGLKNKASIITRDKHHLFTTKLENYLNGYGIEVYNNFPK